MKTGHIAILAIMLLATQPGNAAKRDGFFSQEVSAQHLLLAKGDRFQLLRYNMVGTDPAMARFDQAATTASSQAMQIRDRDTKKQAALYTHDPIVCRPLTEYALRFRSRVASVTGPPPYAEVTLLDFNRDPIETKRLETTATEAQAAWTSREIRFVTPHNGHAVVVYFWSTEAGTCDAAYDDAFLVQTSEGGSAGPEPVALESLTASAMKSDTGTSAPIPLGALSLALELSFRWRDPRDSQSLEVGWMDAAGHAVGSDRCRWSQVLGVRPEWNGVQAEWKRERGDATDRVSQRLERFADASAGAGQGTMEHSLPIPKGAVSVRFRQPGASESWLAINSLKAEAIMPAGRR